MQDDDVRGLCVDADRFSHSVLAKHQGFSGMLVMVTQTGRGLILLLN